jgi:hypothetical protein
VLGSHTLLDALLSDPLAFYPALAALLLAAVAVASGLLRGDVLALARPVPVAWVGAAVAGVWGLGRALGRVDPVWATPANELALAPLALIALAYGPTPALVALALVFAWVGLPQLGAGAGSPAQVWLLALQLSVLGWLAIAPNPRRASGVAGAYVVAAHALTWATAGLAWSALRHGGVSLELLELEHGLRFEGVALLSAALALLPPVVWRALFPGGRLADAAPDAEPARSASALAVAGGEPPASDATRRAQRGTPRRLPDADTGDLTPWRRSRAPRRLADAGAATPEPFRRPSRWSMRVRRR